MWGRSQVVGIKTTTLSLDINKQPNGLNELVLKNNGDKTVEVDWISIHQAASPLLGKGKGEVPLVPSTAGGLSSGSYRNLFVEAGYAPEAVDKKLKEVFNAVFLIFPSFL